MDRKDIGRNRIEMNWTELRYKIGAEKKHDL